MFQARAQLDAALARHDVDPVAVEIFGGRIDPSHLLFPLSRMAAADSRDWDAIEAWGRSLPELAGHPVAAARLSRRRPSIEGWDRRGVGVPRTGDRRREPADRAEPFPRTRDARALTWGGSFEGSLGRGIDRSRVGDYNETGEGGRNAAASGRRGHGRTRSLPRVRAMCAATTPRARRRCPSRRGNGRRRAARRARGTARRRRPRPRRRARRRVRPATRRATAVRGTAAGVAGFGAEHEPAVLDEEDPRPGIAGLLVERRDDARGGRRRRRRRASTIALDRLECVPSASCLDVRSLERERSRVAVVVRDGTGLAARRGRRRRASAAR